MNTKQARDKYYRPSAGSRFLRWFDIRYRELGMWAFILNRITAIGLTVYLLIHLAVLSLLAQGQVAWDTFVALARSPAMLFLDVVLIAGILIHGLNGLRIAFVGMGIGLGRQKSIFVSLMVLALVVIIFAGFRIFAI